MDEKYTNSIIDSTTKYLYNLQYLGDQNPKLLKDLMILSIVKNILNWADWYNVTKVSKSKLEKFLNCMILHNSDLVLPTTSHKDYSNVNTPQTIYTWQRIFDNLDAKEINNLQFNNIISEYNINIQSENNQQLITSYGN